MSGEIVAHYRLIEKIGQGGMGEVYLAEDTRLERKVALKFLPQELTGDPEARQRFEREAKAVAALNHPNIVTIHEIGEHQGRVYMAMEHATGRTLREVIQGSLRRGKPLPLPTVVAIVSQVAAGLSAAHARGIVHRDIKPQNIMVGDDLRVKILDFGLAKLSGISTLTKGTMVLGTMHYLSPEQARGKQADGRSDLWALGVVLYEMLCGRLPFAGESPQAILYSVIKSAPLPLDKFRPGLPSRLLDCVQRLLAKDPGQRYQDSGAFMADLESIGPLPDDGGTEVIRAAGKPAPAARGRRRRLLAGALLGAAAIAALLLLSQDARSLLRRGLGIGNVPRARHLAVLPFVSAGGAESAPLADGFMVTVAETLIQLEQFHESLWTVPAAEILRDRDKTAMALQRLWGCNLFVAGELYLENNSLRLQLKLNDARNGRELNRVELRGHMGNLSIFQDALLSKLCRLLELKEDARAGKAIQAGGTAMPGAFVLFLKGKGLSPDNAAAQQLDQGIALLRRSLQQDGGYTQARLALANALRNRFKQGRSPQLLREAMEQGELARLESGRWAPAQWTWALLLKENGESASAMEALQETLRLNERHYPACIEMARAGAAAGKTNEAERYFKRAIEIRPEYPGALANLAFFYMKNGRTDEAIALYKKQSRLVPGDASACNNLGILYQQKGDKENARAMFEKSNAIEANVPAQSNLATLFFYEGDYRKALPLFREVAVQVDESRWWGNLADTYRQLPEFRDKAAATYRRAIELAEAALARTPDDPMLLSALAMYYAHAGEKGMATDAITRARRLAPADLETIRRSILVYEAMGERPFALSSLREFCERLGGIQEIEKEPDLAGLRSDPEYRKIAPGIK